jgi:uncharacterized protein (DUF885 family)
MPAMNNLHIYIQNEYMNYLRPTPGISALPGGKEMYMGFLKFYSSKDGMSAGTDSFCF